MSRQLLDTDKTTDLITMLLPVQGKHLLLPNVTVAEIIQVPTPGAMDDVPDWFRGMVSWRGYGIPLISFEAFNGEPFDSASESDHAAVLNGSADTAVVPFYAVTTLSTPRMMRINAGEIVNDEVAEPGPAETMVVRVCGEQASIPDLERLETELATWLHKLGFSIGAVG